MSFSRTSTELVIEQRLKLGSLLFPISSLTYLSGLYVFTYTQICNHAHISSTEIYIAHGWANMDVSTRPNNPVLHLKRKEFM